MAREGAPDTWIRRGGNAMKSRNAVIGLVVIIALGAGWYLFRPERLWVNQKVSESLPAAVEPAGAMTVEPVALAQGDFHSGAHETRGTAAIYRLPDGKRVLRLTGFETSNGPDVQVYLVAAADAKDNATVTKAGFVPLGALKGNIGDQNYDVPADVDLSTHRAVTIWCRRFGVNFGTAPLSAAEGANVSMAMPMPEGRLASLSSGMFHSVSHATHGTATVYRLADGSRVLRLTNFETSNGPDVRVYMVAAPDAGDNATVTSAGFVELGALKGNIGDQNYDLPSDLDLGKYRAVTIWCRRFGVNFATAPLAPQRS
jgi:electron transfer DM13